MDWKWTGDKSAPVKKAGLPKKLASAEDGGAGAGRFAHSRERCEQGRRLRANFFFVFATRFLLVSQLRRLRLVSQLPRLLVVLLLLVSAAPRIVSATFFFPPVR